MTEKRRTVTKKEKFTNGALVGRYRIQRPLGGGGQSYVYLATNEKTAQQVALKFLKTDDEEGRARLEREARSAGRIWHRNVVRIWGVDYLGDEPFIVSEYVVGRPLTPDRTRPLDDTLLILRQIAQGLAASHAADIIHRDIKPDNILLKDDGTAVIVDFGLGKSTNLGQHEPTEVDVTGAGTIMGTPGYMSPEQAEARQFGSASDIFSFGVLALELLIFENPFRRSIPAASLLAVLRDAPPKVLDKRRDVPPHIADIVDRCLSREPSRRPTAEEVSRLIDTLPERLRHQPTDRVITKPGGRAVSEVEPAARTTARPKGEGFANPIDMSTLTSVDDVVVSIGRSLFALAPAKRDELLDALDRTIGPTSNVTLVASLIADREDVAGARMLYAMVCSLTTNGNPNDECDFDYFAFLSHELLLTLVASLIRRKRWSMIVACLSDDPTGIPYDRCSEYAEILERRGRQLNRTSLRADLLRERHNNVGTTGLLPFDELLAADFFLFARGELSGARLEWRPWSTVYLRAAPAFVMETEEEEREEIALALGVPAQGLKDRLLQVAVCLNRYWRTGLLTIPLRTLELHEIADAS